jgi:hypothetical protein
VRAAAEREVASVGTSREDVEAAIAAVQAENVPEPLQAEVVAMLEARQSSP